MAKKVKIAIVLPYDPNRPGGVIEHVRAEYIELKKLGYSVKIIAPRPTDNEAAEEPDLIYLGQSTAMRFSAPFHTLFDITTVDNDDIKAVLEEGEFDIESIERELAEKRHYTSTNRWVPVDFIKNGYVLKSYHTRLISDAHALDYIIF